MIIRYFESLAITAELRNQKLDGISSIWMRYPNFIGRKLVFRNFWIDFAVVFLFIHHISAFYSTNIPEHLCQVSC